MNSLAEFWKSYLAVVPDLYSAKDKTRLCLAFYAGAHAATLMAERPGGAAMARGEIDAFRANLGKDGA